MVGFLVLLIRGLPRFKMDAPVFLVPDKRLLAGFTVAFFGVTIFVEARPWTAASQLNGSDNHWFACPKSTTLAWS